jgi:DNA-binding NarL/FixJ family response regulator
VIRVVVVADSGTVMSALTQSLVRIPRVEIAAYASGTSHVDEVVRAVQPDVVLIHEMDRPGAALRRISETRQAQPLAAVLGLSSPPSSRWVAEALRAGATAVVPADLDPATLDVVLREVLEAPSQVSNPEPSPARSAA